MKQTKLVLHGCAFMFVTAIGLGAPSVGRAAGCGDGIVDQGETCDPGAAQLDVGCCDSTCHWKNNGDPCSPIGGDACNQGTCGNGHSCDAPNPLIDPCLSTANCNLCVVTGPKTQNFSCTTGDDAPDGTLCTVGGDRCRVCVDGACTGFKTCAQPSNSCKIADCVEATGACETVDRSPGTFCNDGRPCTRNEQCDSNGHCDQSIVNVTNNTPCDDGNDCTTGEKCSAGNCTGGTNVTNGTACDDFNDCQDGTTCTNGTCGGGTPNETGTECVDGRGSICRNEGTCTRFPPPFDSISLCYLGAPQNEGATCTLGNPCNDGFCSAGACIVRDFTQTSGTVEDYNACTDPGSTTCNEAGLVVGTSCVTGSCPTCGAACQNDPNLQFGGAALPCSCTFTQ